MKKIEFWGTMLLSICFVAALGHLTGNYLLFSIPKEENAVSQQSKQVSIQSKCNLDEGKFITTVNTWRKEHNEQPLIESNSLDMAAESRLNDMLNYKYYGHTNPVTKVPSYVAISAIDKNSRQEGEVLAYSGSTSDPTDAVLAKFKGSPEHYQVLLSPTYHYVGADFTTTLAYEPSYDDNGNLDTTSSSHAIAGSDCMIVADLADN